ncbi:MAG: helix-turn-helix domain-containing protein, partial [Candidatus Marinimicrobia bacterium]|nr:helix-turn-helix domain-containing protein [Candidatus Neomarinimicrobiota bacterium]
TSLPLQVEALEKQLIVNSLHKTQGNQSQAARLLNITERNLRYKIKKYNLK